MSWIGCVDFSWNVFDDRVWAEKEFEWVELILIVDDKYQNVGLSSNDSILEIGDWGQPIFSHPKSLLWKEWGETKFTFIKCYGIKYLSHWVTL